MILGRTRRDRFKHQRDGVRIDLTEHGGDSATSKRQDRSSPPSTTQRLATQARAKMLRLFVGRLLEANATTKRHSTLS